MTVDVCGSQDRTSAAVLIAIVLVVLKTSVLLYRGPETSDGPSGEGRFYTLQLIQVSSQGSEPRYVDVGSQYLSLI
jgi:hypothetical protein